MDSKTSEFISNAIKRIKTENISLALFKQYYYFLVGAYENGRYNNAIELSKELYNAHVDLNTPEEIKEYSIYSMKVLLIYLEANFDDTFEERKLYMKKK